MPFVMYSIPKLFLQATVLHSTRTGQICVRSLRDYGRRLCSDKPRLYNSRRQMIIVEEVIKGLMIPYSQMSYSSFVPGLLIGEWRR